MRSLACDPLHGVYTSVICIVCAAILTDFCSMMLLLGLTSQKTQTSNIRTVLNTVMEGNSKVKVLS